MTGGGRRYYSSWKGAFVRSFAGPGGRACRFGARRRVGRRVGCAGMGRMGGSRVALKLPCGLVQVGQSWQPPRQGQLPHQLPLLPEDNCASLCMHYTYCSWSEVGSCQR